MFTSSEKEELKSKSICVLCAIGFAFLFVMLIISPENINPDSTEWVLHGGGDNYQHYIGWRFFRNEPWSHHILSMQGLNYPVGTSVIVVDSNPLFCLIFKALRNIIPDSFQFNGLWLLCSYTLIAIFTALIAWKISRNIYLTISCILLSILNPVVLQRALIHDTLTAHWLILAAIWLFLNRREKWNCAGWFLLSFLTLAIHFYFLPMVMYILCLELLSMMLEHFPLKNMIGILVCSALSLCLGYYGLGYCYILPESGSYGELTLNLNAFINPDGTSLLLGNRTALPLQYEGYNYLGLGMIVILCLGVVASVFHGDKKFLVYAIPSLVLLFAAVSNNGYFDKQLIYHFELPEKVYQLLSIFRSSGRLVWPLYYLILFFALKMLLANPVLKKWCIGIFWLCLILQAVDLSGFMKSCAERFRNPANEFAELPEAVISEIPSETGHLFVESSDSKILDAWALYAAEHFMTYNKSSNARKIMPIYSGDPILLPELTCDKLETGAVYLYDESASVPEPLSTCEGIASKEIPPYRLFYLNPG